MSASKLIDRIINLENKMDVSCQELAREAMKKAPFLEDISCAYYQSDGVCIEIPKLLDQECITISAREFFKKRGKFKNEEEILYL